jgi:hypothetical protein
MSSVLSFLEKEKICDEIFEILMNKSLDNEAKVDEVKELVANHNSARFAAIRDVISNRSNFPSIDTMLCVVGAIVANEAWVEVQRMNFRKTLENLEGLGDFVRDGLFVFEKEPFSEFFNQISVSTNNPKVDKLMALKKVKQLVEAEKSSDPIVGFVSRVLSSEKLKPYTQYFTLQALASLLPSEVKALIRNRPRNVALYRKVQGLFANKCEEVVAEPTVEGGEEVVAEPTVEDAEEVDDESTVEGGKGQGGKGKGGKGKGGNSQALEVLERLATQGVPGALESITAIASGGRGNSGGSGKGGKGRGSGDHA